MIKGPENDVGRLLGPLLTQCTDGGQPHPRMVIVHRRGKVIQSLCRSAHRPPRRRPDPRIR